MDARLCCEALRSGIALQATSHAIDSDGHDAFSVEHRDLRLEPADYRFPGHIHAGGMTSNGHTTTSESTRLSSYSASPQSRISGHTHDHDDPLAESSSQAESRTSGSRNSAAGSATTGRLNEGIFANSTPESNKGRLLGGVRKRQRDSGGFLLGNSFGRQKHLQDDQDRRKSKGKEKATRPSDHQVFEDRHAAGSPSISFTPSPNAEGDREATANAPQHAGLGLDISGVDGDDDDGEDDDRRNRHNQHARLPRLTPRPAGSQLDPTQLVQMALSLNEGRRRYASTGLNVPAPNADTRRVRSAGAAQINVAPGSPLGNDENVSLGVPEVPDVSSESAQSPHHARLAYENDNDSQDMSGLQERELSVQYQFSPATLARAEKARTFFELYHEYYRLLEYLPPMKPKQSSSVDSTALGRQYNPLQSLRNRRTRTRERRPLLPAPSAFENVPQVREWLDDVEDSLDSTDNLAETNNIPMPPFASMTQERNFSGPNSIRGHRRTDTVSPKMEWTESGWTIAPMELFADTVWSEDPNNKHHLEDRRGRKIYAALPRISLDRRASMVHESSPPVQRRGRSATVGSTNVADGESDAHQPRKRKFLSIHRVEDDVLKRLPWHRRRSVDSVEDSDVSDTAVRQKSPKARYDPAGENIGPLVRRMQEIMDKEGASGSPELISPGKWNDLPQSAQGNPSARASPSSGAELSSPLRRQRPRPLEFQRSRSYSEGNDASRPVSMADDTDSPAPNTPAIKSAVPTMGMRLSPPHAEDRSATSWSAQKFLGRSSRQSSPERPLTTETTDFAPGASTTSITRQTDEDSPEGLRKSFESWSRPSFLRQHKTNESVDEGSGTSNGQPKAPSRGMSRLLKAGRIGDLVRTESSRFGDRLRRKDQEESLKRSDSHEDSGTITEGEEDQAPKRTSNDSLRPEGRTERPKYHMQLPSFRPTNSTDDISSMDPITQQQTARKAQSRFNLQNRLPLSRIIVPGSDRGKSSSAETGEDDRSDTPSQTHKRGNSVRLFLPKRTRSTMTTNQGPGNVPPETPVRAQDGSPTPGLKRAATDKDKQAFNRGRRHWSIADQSKTQAPDEQVVTPQDVARVKALFLSSGIKAHELCLRSSSISDIKPRFLTSVAEKSGEDITRITKRQEFVVAAELWSRMIETSMKASQTKLDGFREKSAQQTRTRIEQLRQKAAEQLTMRVHETADEADAFAIDLNTHQTLAVKQVNDAIDEMIRKRRRNLKLVKKVGWTLLEWVLLGVMWWLWFLVVVWRSLRDAVMGVVRGVRWVLWV